MPIPFLIAGLALAAGAIGAAGHAEAKETNEKAQRIAKNAQDLYDTTKASLEEAQKSTEEHLLKLGYAKKQVLETSIDQFLHSYSRIKDIELCSSQGIDEISKFTIEETGAIQLREMTDIYKSLGSSAATGAATGAVVALAASGSLPIVTGVLSTAGTALMAGQVGVAASLAGSALSFGAAMTPLAAIAAPALLFSGISSSMKADENLEKARTMYAEAEAASEQMKTSIVLCEAISDKSSMFGNLLNELNVMFAKCTKLLDGVTRKKSGFFGKKIAAQSLTEDEMKLVAVTRALAGAIKAVIDTPILNNDGEISFESKTVYNKTTQQLPNFKQAVIEVEACDYKTSSIPVISDVRNFAASSGTLNDYRPIVKYILWFFTFYFMFQAIVSIFLFSIGRVLINLSIAFALSPKIKPDMPLKKKLTIAIILYFIKCIVF